MNIYQRLIEVKKSIDFLKKDSKGYGYQYVSSSQTLLSLRSKMNEMGLILVPSVIDSEIRNHTTEKGKHEYFTILEMNFTWVNSDKPDETVSCGWTGQGLDSGEKGVGKALTYAEKYFLLKFFNIPTDKDDPDSFQKNNAKKEGQVNEEKAIEALDKFVDPKNTDKPEVKLESLNALWNAHYVPKLYMFSPKGKTAVENTYKEVVSILEEQIKGPDTSKDVAEIDEKKAVDSLDVFADPADKRPPAIKLKLIEAFWNKHYEPNLHLFSDKGKSDVINTYHGVVDVLTSQGKDNERNN